MPKRKTQEEFEEKVKALVGCEYSVIGNYKNYKTKIKMRHNCDKCNNHEWDILPSNFFRGKRCPECFGSFRKTQKQFEKEVYDLVGDEYIILGEYINNNTKVKMRHNSSKCNNHIFEVEPRHFLSDESKCPKCFGSFRKTQKQFEKEVKTLVGNEYSILGKYVNANTKIKMKHNSQNCNNYEYMVTPTKFLIGHRCPRCNESKGEKAISKFLNKKSRKFKSQYRLQNCRSEYPLPFDIAILNDKKEIVGLIEYDGEQHFREVKRFGGKEGFLERKRNDEIKTSYCENHLNSTSSY